MVRSSKTAERFVPALRFRILTGLYDPLMATVMRESDWKAELVEQAVPRDDLRVLDLGCGTGTLTARLARSRRNVDVVGVDADSSVLGRARSRLATEGVRASLVEARAEALPLGDASFDRVVSSLLFHHLTTESKRAALREARRVLKPGGELHVADWARPEDSLMRLAFVPVRLLDGFETTADTVKGALPGLIAAAGFDQVEETRRRRTVFGTLAFLRAHGQPAAGQEAPRSMESARP